MNPSYNLVLASTSPRRQELIKHLRLPYVIRPSAYEEIMDPAVAPGELVQKLAEEKARDVLNTMNIENGNQDLAVLGADTIVVLDGKFLGKPQNKDDAFHMLKKLSGRCHEVYTGVAILLSRGTGQTVQLIKDFEISQVWFREIHDEEIRNYIETSEPMDKAGAYALQGTGSAFVKKIDGCFTNIIGLPIPKVVSLLRLAGIEVLGRAVP